MKVQEINDLIEKYFVGETSLEEEKILRGYFSGSNIDARLASYTPLFQFFEKEKQTTFDNFDVSNIQNLNNITQNPKPQIQNFKILRGGIWKIAATLAFLVVGSVVIFKVLESKPKPIALQHKKAKMIILDGEGDEKEALTQVNAALALVSKKMKKGTDKTNESLLKLRDATEILNNDN